MYLPFMKRRIIRQNASIFRVLFKRKFMPLLMMPLLMMSFSTLQSLPGMVKRRGQLTFMDLTQDKAFDQTAVILL